MNWKVGDKAIIDCPDCNIHGEIVTIRAVNVTISTLYDGVFTGAEVDVETDHPDYTYCVFQYHELRPIPDQYDGLQVTTWDECPWKPEKIEVLE